MISYNFILLTSFSECLCLCLQHSNVHVIKTCLHWNIILIIRLYQFNKYKLHFIYELHLIYTCLPKWSDQGDNIHAFWSSSIILDTNWYLINCFIDVLIKMNSILDFSTLLHHVQIAMIWNDAITSKSNECVLH